MKSELTSYAQVVDECSPFQLAYEQFIKTISFFSKALFVNLIINWWFILLEQCCKKNGIAGEEIHSHYANAETTWKSRVSQREIHFHSSRISKPISHRPILLEYYWIFHSVSQKLRIFEDARMNHSIWKNQIIVNAENAKVTIPRKCCLFHFNHLEVKMKYFGKIYLRIFIVVRWKFFETIHTFMLIIF